MTFDLKIGIMDDMKIKKQLQNDLKDAMRAKDDQRKNTIRMALAAVKNTEIDRGHELEDNEVQAIIQKEVKSRREAMEDAEQAQRPDIVANNAAEIEILEAYLPKQLTPDEIEVLAREAIDEVGATSSREIGQVMKVLMPRVRGQADGKEVNQIVRQLLV